MAEEAARDPNQNWEGSPLQMGSGLDPYGIKEIVLEYDTGEQEILRPKLREEFRSYELHESSSYLETLARALRHTSK